MTDLERFRPLAYAIARDYFLPGGDVDDVRQEAMIGVWKALRDYRPDGGKALPNFVALCVRRQLITAVKTATRVKHEALTFSDRIGEDVGAEIRPRTTRDSRRGRTWTAMHAKSVDNALQRARRKLADPFEARCAA